MAIKSEIACKGGAELPFGVLKSLPLASPRPVCLFTNFSRIGRVLRIKANEGKTNVNSECRNAIQQRIICVLHVLLSSLCEGDMVITLVQDVRASQ